MAANELTEAHGMRPEEFDAIREAVMETPRGRWFLGEYAARMRSADTSKLLDNMKRLETAVSSNHDALMSRLAQAMAREPGAAAASAPQADLAPRHLKFFKQDEELFEPAQPKQAPVAEAPKAVARPEVPKGAKVVFRRAEESSVTVEAPLSPVAEVPAEAEAIAAPSVEPAPPQPVAEAQPKRRIVIIRHKPGEDIDVPLQDEIAQAS